MRARCYFVVESFGPGVRSSNSSFRRRKIRRMKERQEKEATEAKEVSGDREG